MEAGSTVSGELRGVSYASPPIFVEIGGKRKTFNKTLSHYSINLGKNLISVNFRHPVDYQAY